MAHHRSRRPTETLQVRLDGKRGPFYLEFKMTSPRLPDQQWDADTAASLKLWITLARASSWVTERSRRHIESRGLSTSEFGVLEILYHKGPLTIGEIGNRMLMTSGSMTYVVDKLESRKLLVRRVSTDDRRAIVAELTPEGSAFIAEIFPAHAEVIRKATAGLTVEEKRIAAALLRRLGKHAQAMS
jgi:MarR family 2-MHQ and catechol resistance regulon transcriptional repressor